ncbi:50S ribosomal protein L13 [Candidatus Undinarchaeota archaeon]
MSEEQKKEQKKEEKPLVKEEAAPAPAKKEEKKAEAPKAEKKEDKPPEKKEEPKAEEKKEDKPPEKKEEKPTEVKEGIKEEKPEKKKTPKKFQKKPKKPKIVFDENSVLYDAENVILGRLASHVAKDALNGKKVFIINSEKAIISGNKKTTIANRRFLREEIGSRYHGPFYPRRPDMYVKRTIRGMLPWKKTRGREAFKRIRAYLGVPQELEGKKSVETDYVMDNMGTLKFIPLGKLCKTLGWNE